MGEVLKYSKTQSALYERQIVGRLLYSENKDTNKHFQQEGLQNKLKSSKEETKLLSVISQVLAFSNKNVGGDPVISQVLASSNKIVGGDPEFETFKK